MIKNQPNKQRILQNAAQLFYRNGYANTGIAEILANSNITRPTLYYYFQSKAGLGHEYLAYQQENFLKPLRKWVNSKESLSTFLLSWAQILERGARCANFYGCPFATFAGQLNQQALFEFQTHLQEIENDMRGLIVTLLERLRAEDRVIQSVNIDTLAKEVLIAYEGCANLWRMSKDISYFDRLRARFLELALTVEKTPT